MSKLITTSLAAKMLGFTPDYIRRLILDGKIKAEKLGHNWVFTEAAIKHVKRIRFSKKED